MTSRTGSAWRIWGIWRKLEKLRRDTEREGLTFACSRRPWAGVARDAGADEKARIERVYFSLLVEKPLNSKVMKCFVPELRSRKCFSCFEIPMLYIYIYIYIYIYVNIPCTFRIFMYMAMVHYIHRNRLFWDLLDWHRNI